MNSVRSTQINSVNEKKKELEQMITNLLARKELLDVEVKAQLVLTDDIKERRDAMNKEIQEFDSTLEAMHLSVVQLQEYYTQLAHQIELSLQGFSKYLVEVDSHLNQQEQKIKDLQQEYKNVHDKMVLELEQLAINKKDLDIYRTRLEKKCAELYPGIKIIL